MVQFSVPDLACNVEGFTRADALCSAFDLVQHAEAAGHTRFRPAKDRKLAGIACAAAAK